MLMYSLFSHSYVIDLTYYLLAKTDGKSWQEEPAVERLVEVRTVSNTLDKCNVWILPVQSSCLVNKRFITSEDLMMEIEQLLAY